MKNKKSVILIISLIAVFTVKTPLVFAQQTDPPRDFVVESVGTGIVARLTGYNGSRTAINIPVRILSMTVVGIGEGAFSGKGITGVTIPGSVILIESRAFAGNQITQITIGTDVTCHPDSFEFRFVDFYNENGRRAGTYVYSNGAWAIQLVETPPPDSRTTEPSTTDNASGKFDLEPYAVFFVGMGLWDYGPSILHPRLGVTLGLLFEFTNFKIGFAGEGGVFLGLAFPFFEDIGINYGYWFGSYLEFFVADSWGFSLGGGMSRFHFNTKDDMSDGGFFPYAEINLFIGDDHDRIGIWFRYYFNDSDHSYNRFSTGIKISEW